MTGPKASPDGVRVEYRGERLAVLYRFYPLEYMQEQANVPALARATELGELTSVSSFAAIHAQSKLAMARGWLAEPAASSGVFPETYAFRTLDGATLARERRDRVLKRDLSRVGDHVVVGALETDEAFRAALYAVDEAEAEGEEDDLHASFGAWQAAGLGIHLVDLDFLSALPPSLDRADRAARLAPQAYWVRDRYTLVDDPVFYGRARAGFGLAFGRPFFGSHPFHGGGGYGYGTHSRGGGSSRGSGGRATRACNRQAVSCVSCSGGRRER